jgi:hypothetical protein
MSLVLAITVEPAQGAGRTVGEGAYRRPTPSPVAVVRAPLLAGGWAERRRLRLSPAVRRASRGPLPSRHGRGRRLAYRTPAADPCRAERDCPASRSARSATSVDCSARGSRSPIWGPRQRVDADPCLEIRPLRAGAPPYGRMVGSSWSSRPGRRRSARPVDAFSRRIRSAQRLVVRRRDPTGWSRRYPRLASQDARLTVGRSRRACGSSSAT